MAGGRLGRCLGVMAAGCVVNALRCGRMHCYFTGPFMILMGFASLSYGFGWLPLGINGWNRIGGVTLARRSPTRLHSRTSPRKVSATLLSRAVVPPGEKWPTWTAG